MGQANPVSEIEGSAPLDAGSSATGLRRNLVLAVALVGAVLLSFRFGAYEMGVGDVLNAVLKAASTVFGQAELTIEEQIFLQIRLPRVLLGALAGAGLGLAGALTQAVFRNPLASPSVIGVTGGAAAGAALAILIGAPAYGAWAVPAAGFLAALLTTSLVYRFALLGGRMEIVSLLLAGIAVNAMTSAVVNLVKELSDQSQLQSVVFWLLGSASGATWPKIGAMLSIMLPGLVLPFFFARALNIMALGDGEARDLGVNVRRVRLLVVVSIALAAGSAVSICGIIPFVGLIAPHIMRSIVGPNHRALLPASLVGGAILVIAADSLARTAVAPAQLALGLPTSLLGGPFFLYLIYRTRKTRSTVL